MDSYPEHLLCFLKDHIDQFTNMQLSSLQLQRLNAFYIADGLHETVTDGDPYNHPFSDKELLRYIVMGWFIYYCIRLDQERVD